MINIKLLRKTGAVERRIIKGEILFFEGDNPVFYYQILTGAIKMNNYNEEGYETIHAIFTDGQSLGEPAILGGFPFPANAVALENTLLLCLEKNRFWEMVEKHPSISMDLLKTISKRLRFKTMVSKEINGQEAEHRILSLLRHFKSNNEKGDNLFEISLTRKTIASMIGLRVETVIRAIGELKKKGMIEVRNRKIYI
jgi:CRP-like cAMP-binding protein